MIRSRRPNWAVVAGVAVPLVVAVGSIGAFWLTAPHGRHPASHAVGPAFARGPSGTAGQPKPSPSASPKRHKRRHRKVSPANLSLAQHPNQPLASMFVGVVPSGSIVSGVDSFAGATGAHIALVEIYASFGASFPQPQASRIISVGATPLIQWDPTRVPLGQIAAGGYDGYLRQYAQAVKGFGHHVVLSFGHEFNGSWEAWGFGNASPAQFVAAWRRIHTIFSSQGVQNVTWSWDPSHTGAAPNPWWPGPGYVDEIGIDGYLRPGQTFAEIFAGRLADIRSFTGKPIFIAETAVAPSPGAASQIVGLFYGVAQYHLTGFVWFDINHLEPWHLEGRQVAVSTFRSMVTCMSNSG